MSRLSENYDFYVNLYPVLALPGWQEIGRGYGTINWHMLFWDPVLKIRAYILVRHGSAKIGLEVRHPAHGLASCTLGDETLTPEQFSSGIEKEFHRLSQDVWRQYQEWSAAIDKEIKEARQGVK